MSAEYDGSIKLGVSVSADTKSVVAELNALRKQIVDMFSSVDKSLAGGSGSFANIEKILTKISEDISHIGKAISVLPESKVVKVVESVKSVGTASKGSASEISTSASKAVQSIDLENASLEELYQTLKKVRAEQAEYAENQKFAGYTAEQLQRDKIYRGMSNAEFDVSNEISKRKFSDMEDYSPHLLYQDSMDAYEQSIQQAESALAQLKSELSSMSSDDGGFDEKTARAQELSSIIETLYERWIALDSANSQSMATSEIGTELPASDVGDSASATGAEVGQQFVESAKAEIATGIDQIKTEAEQSKVEIPVDTYTIEATQKRLLELQGRMKSFKAGKISLSDEEVATVLNEIDMLKVDLQQATDFAKQLELNSDMDDEFVELIGRAQQLKAELDKFEKTGMGFFKEDAKEAYAELQRIQQKIQQYKDSIHDVSDAPMDKPYKDLVETFNSLNKQVKDFANTGVGFASAEEAQRAASLVGTLKKQIDEYKKSIDDASKQNLVQGDLGKLIQEYNELNSAVKKFKQTGVGMDDKQFGDATVRIAELKKRIDSMQRSLSVPKGFAGFITMLKNISSEAGKASKTATKMGNAFTKSLNNLKGKIKGVIGWFKKLRGQSNSTTLDIQKGFKKATATFAKVFLGVRGLYMAFRKLRSAVIESFKEMATQVPEVNTMISNFVTALNQVKGSLGTAFQPIASVVLPVLTQLLNVLNQAIVALGQFFAILSGKGKIYKYTAAQVDYADSISETASNANEAKKALMGFDEINKLPDNSDSSGSGGTSGGGTYEEVDVDPNSAVSNFAKMLKDAWANADFFDVGQFLGTTFKDGLDSLDKWLTTDGYAIATKLGKSFATLINGIVSVDGLANTVGRTVADAINTGMIGLNTFLVTTNWYDVGKFIADTITSFIDNVNWTLFGQLVANYLLAGINTWWSFIGNFDFTKLGNKLATAINSFFKTMGNVDESGLSGWQKLGQAISGTIKGILTTIITALNTVNWNEVGTAIGELISSIDWAGVVWDFTQLVSAVVSAIAQAFQSWSETDPISAAIASMIGVAVIGAKIIPTVLKVLPFLSKLGEVFSLVAGGAETLHEALVAVFGVVGTTIAGIASVFTGAIIAISSFVSMFVKGFSWIKEILMVVGIAIAAVGAVILGAPALVAAIVAGIVAAVATLVVLIKEHWTDICNWFSNAWKSFCTGWTNFWNGVGQVASLVWTTIKATVSLAITAIKTTITNGITAIQTWWTTALTAIATTASTIWNGIKTSISTSITGIKTTIITVVTAIQTWLSTTWTSISTTASTIWTGIKTTITTVVTAIKTGISNALSAIPTIWSNIWNTVKSTTVSIFSGISGTIKGAVNGIIGFINGMIRGVVSGMNGMIGALNKISVDVPDWIPEIGGKKFGFNLSTITAPQIPLLAQGAVLPPNKPFAAIVGDQSHGTNVEAPLATIEEAVANVLDEQLDAMAAMAEAIVSAINGKDLSVQIGDKDIGQANDRYTRRQAMMRGTT